MTEPASPADARTAILARLRQVTQGKAATAGHANPLAGGRGPLPAPPAAFAGDRAGLFIERARQAQAEVMQIPDSGIAAGLAAWLRETGAPPVIQRADHPLLRDRDWAGEGLRVAGPAGPAAPAGVSAAFAGVAETGTLVMASGLDSPVLLNFVPEFHCVVLQSSRIYPWYEDVWDVLRAEVAAGKRAWPETVNMITGPSRTGDVEQTIVVGAHGPRRLLILLVGP